MMQKYRADYGKPQADRSVHWYARWIGGPSLAKVEFCRTMLQGDPRVTAFVTGEPDTWFSIPAVCSYRGCRVTGYLTSDDDGIVFHHCYY